MFRVGQYNFETETCGYLEKTSGHQMTYVAFWDESVFTSICIKNSYFSVPFEPADCLAGKICFWYIQLQEG
jgi:hypothetical protein